MKGLSVVPVPTVTVLGVVQFAVIVEYTPHDDMLATAIAFPSAAPLHKMLSTNVVSIPIVGTLETKNWSTVSQPFSSLIVTKC